ncbi:MAG: hypothetical protein WA461_06360, partial [Nitrososphaeraceae archaeon]
PYSAGCRKALDSTLIHCIYETVESPAAPIVTSCHLIGNSSDRKCIFLPGYVVLSLGPISESCFFIDSERIL